MATKRLSRLNVYHPDTRDPDRRIDVDGDNDISLYLRTFPQIEYKLGETPKMTFQVESGSEWIAGRVLGVRQRVYVQWDDNTLEPFRIRRIRLDASGKGAARVECLGRLADLGDRLAILFDTQRTYWPISNLPLDDALVLLFGGTSVISYLPLSYATNPVGDIASIRPGVLRDEEYRVSLDVNNTSVLQVLSDITEQVFQRYGVTMEARPWGVEGWGTVTPDPATGRVDPTALGTYIALYTELGWTDAEITARAADPTLRPIQAPTAGAAASTRNRIELELTEEHGQGFYTRLFPTAGPDDFYTGIDGAYLTSTAVTYDATSDLTEVTLDLDIIWAHNALTHQGSDELQAGRPNYVHWVNFQPVGVNPLLVDVGAIVRSAVPNKIWLSGNQPLGRTYVLQDERARPALAKALSHKDHWTYGEVERAVRWPQIPPVRNEFEDVASGDADMSGPWTGPVDQRLPAGWQPYPATNQVVTAEETAELYTYYGTKTLKVTAPVGQGVRTVAWIPSVMPDDPYYSIWSSVAVNSGTRIRLELIDGEGTVWPTGTVLAESTSSAIRALSVGGMEPKVSGLTAPGNQIYVRITVIEGGETDGKGVFYLDAFAAMVSHVPFPYQEDMGKRGLLRRAAEEMGRSAGFQVNSYQAEAIDLSWDDASYELIEIGSHVQLRDFYVAGTGWTVSVDGRVERLTVDTSPVTGYRKRMTVARRQPQFADRFVEKTVGRPLADTPPTEGETSTTPSVGSDFLDDAIYGLSELIHDHGWTEIKPQANDSAFIQVAGGKPIAKGILTVERVTQNQGGSDQWAVQNRNIAHDVFQVRLQDVNSTLQEYKWGWIYPGRLPREVCDWENVLASDLVLHVDFEEGAGQVLHDLARQGLNGHIGWSTVYQAASDPKWIDAGLQFNRASGHITRFPLSVDKWGNSGSASFISGSEWTVVWVGTPYVSTPKAIHYAFGNMGTFDANWFLYSGSDTFFYGYDDGVSRNRGSFTEGSDWHVAAYVRDGSESRLYLDRGVLVDSFTSTANPFQSSTSILLLGGDANRASGYSGDMGYFLVYDAPKTQDQLKRIFDTLQCIMLRRGVYFPIAPDLAPIPRIEWLAATPTVRLLAKVSSAPSITWSASTISFGLLLPQEDFAEFLLSACSITGVSEGSDIVRWTDHTANKNHFITGGDPPVYRGSDGWRGGPAADFLVNDRTWLVGSDAFNIGSGVQSIFFRLLWEDSQSWLKLFDSRDGTDGVYLHTDTNEDLLLGDSTGNLFTVVDFVEDNFDFFTQWVDLGVVLDRKTYRIYARSFKHNKAGWWQTGSMARVADFGNNQWTIGAHWQHLDNGFEGKIQAAALWNGVALTVEEFDQVGAYIDYELCGFTGSDPRLYAENLTAYVVQTTNTASDQRASYRAPFLRAEDLTAYVVQTTNTASDQPVSHTYRKPFLRAENLTAYVMQTTNTASDLQAY